MLSKIKSIITLLQGKKTYIVAGVLVFFGSLDLITGQMSLVDFLNSADLKILLNGLGLASLRAGLSNAISLVLRYLNMIELNKKEEKVDESISDAINQG